jgi:peptidoglycan/LPS O-acetylase OafA/YrhL
MMKTLGVLATGRDNNLNLIRMIAASAVLVSHAFPIALGEGTPEPLKAGFGYSLGTLSVFAFFIISGFLIAASYERSSSRRRFLAARTLRLFPGLIVSLLLVAFVMGPVVTTLPVVQYLSDPDTYRFILRNTALISPQYTLPGVFETNPYPTVEGSIWTLVYEVLCYVGVFVLGVLGLLRWRWIMALIFAGYLLAWFAIPLFEVDIHHKLEALCRLSLPFALGTALYVWQDRIVLIWPVALGLVLLAWLCIDTMFQAPVTVIALGYAGWPMCRAVSCDAITASGIIPTGSTSMPSRCRDWRSGRWGR